MSEYESSKPKVLIYQSVDCALMGQYIASKGFEVTIATRENIKQYIDERFCDICILDFVEGLPPDDLGLLSYLNDVDGSIPVLILSDKPQYSSMGSYVARAFRASVDDYMTRPCNWDELIFRLNAILRRTGMRSKVVRNVYNVGSFTLDVAARTLTRNSGVINLQSPEAKILAILCAYDGEPTPIGEILKYIWPDNSYANKRSVNVYIHNLRKYLAADQKVKIATLRGFGYALKIKS